MSSKKTPRDRAPADLNPLRLPSDGATAVNQLRPIESPTMGATSLFANASLQSPVTTPGTGFEIPAGENLPKGLMPPPPARAGSSLVQTRSSTGSISAGNISSAVLPPPLRRVASDEVAQLDAQGGSPSGAPLDRRGSISPNKRRRDGESAWTESAESSSSSSARATGEADTSRSEKSDRRGSVLPPRIKTSASSEELADDDSPLSPTKRSRSFTKAAAAAAAAGEAAAPMVSSRSKPIVTPKTSVVDIFSPGMLRVPVFRIPALLTLPNGVCLAFAEARPHLHDSGVIDLVMRRSTDHGRNWSGAKVILEGSMLGAARAATVGNPTAVYDAHTSTIWLLLCSNYKDDAEWMIHAREGKESRRVWVTSSADLGKSWARPKEITSSVKLPSWTWYATGPGIGVQTESGRLVIPCNHAEDVAEYQCPYLVQHRRSRMVAHSIYSDDHGKSWKLGGIAAKHTNESCVALMPSGELILNARDWSGRFLRVIHTSNDEGKTWKNARHDATLIEPEPQGCQGSTLASDGGTLFFCNPSSDRREMLTVRRSDDGGKSWSQAFCLEQGARAYAHTPSSALTHTPLN